MPPDAPVRRSGAAAGPARAIIESAALECVSRRSLAATTVNDVVTEAAVDRETFYGTFTSMSDCFATAAAAARARVRAAFAPPRVPGEDDRDHRGRALAAGLAELADDPAATRCLFIEAVHLRPVPPGTRSAHRVLDGQLLPAAKGTSWFADGYLALVEQRIRDEVALGRTTQLRDLRDELVAVADRLLR